MALQKAGYPNQREPPGLISSDEKRPDGVTLIPWDRGVSLAWDVIVTCTLAPSHLEKFIIKAGAAAEQAEARKLKKYSDLTHRFLVTPLALETHGPIGELGAQFLRDLGNRMAKATDDRRQGKFLFQRLSLCVQRGNAAAVLGAMPRTLTYEE